MKESEKMKANEVSVVVTESSPLIKRVDIVNNGTDGLKVTYAIMMSRNGVSNIKDRPNEWQHRPVQKELRNYFELLKEHLLKCVGFYWSNETVLEMLKANVSVSYILTGPDDKFMIGGKNKVMEGVTAINSPLLKPEDYDGYEEMKEIVNKIHAEAKLYISGVKGADNRLLTIDYMKSKKNVSDAEKSYDDMSEEERETMMKEAFGHYELEMVEEDGKTVIGVKEVADFVEAPVTEEIVVKKVEKMKDESFKTIPHPAIPNKTKVVKVEKKEEISFEEEGVSFIEDDLENEAPVFNEEEPSFDVETPVAKKGKK